MIRKPISFPGNAPLTRSLAAAVVQTASAFEARVMIQHDQKIVNAKSMLGLLSLGADDRQIWCSLPRARTRMPQSTLCWRRLHKSRGNRAADRRLVSCIMNEIGRVLPGHGRTRFFDGKNTLSLFAPGKLKFA